MPVPSKSDTLRVASAFIEAFHHAFGSTPGRFFTS
jgi:hypothetical protein